MSQFSYPSELDPERIRKVRQVEREQNLMDARVADNYARNQAYKQWSPIRSKIGRQIFRFRETNPVGTPLPSELLRTRDEANEGLAQSLSPMAMQNERLSQRRAAADASLTEQQAAAEPANAQARLAAGRGAHLEGFGRAFTAPLASIINTRTQAGADRYASDNALKGTERTAVADENVARSRARGDIGSAQAQADAQRYAVDRDYAQADMVSQRRLQGDLARAQGGGSSTIDRLNGIAEGKAPSQLLQPQQTQAATIPPDAINLLKQDPSEEAMAEFDEMFGQGAARRLLGM